MHLHLPKCQYPAIKSDFIHLPVLKSQEESRYPSIRLKSVLEWKWNVLVLVRQWGHSTMCWVCAPLLQFVLLLLKFHTPPYWWYFSQIGAWEDQIFHLGNRCWDRICSARHLLGVTSVKEERERKQDWAGWVSGHCADLTVSFFILNIFYWSCYYSSPISLLYSPLTSTWPPTCISQPLV